MKSPRVRYSRGALLAVVAVASEPGHDGRAMQAPAAATIVASYAQGRFDEAQAALIRVSDYAAFQRDAEAALTTVHPAVAEALLLEASQAATICRFE